MFPRWMYAVIVIWAVLSVGFLVYVFNECGAQALLLGQGAGPAALMGMCN